MGAFAEAWERYSERYDGDPRVLREIELAYYAGALDAQTLTAKEIISPSEFLTEMEEWLQNMKSTL